jgi:hypothetical protein
VKAQDRKELAPKPIASYLNLIKPLEIKEGKPGKYFVTGDEPVKNYNKQHLIRKHLKESTLIKAGVVELVPVNEIIKRIF